MILSARVRAFATVVTFSSVLATSLHAQAKQTPYSPEFEAKVRAQFFTGDQPSSQKIDAYIARLVQKKAEITAIVEGQVRLKADRKGKEAKEKKLDKAVDKSNAILALDLAIEKMQAMKKANAVEALALAADESDLEGSIRIEGRDLMIVEAQRALMNVVKKWKVSKKQTATDEASNLWDSAKGRYLTQQDIQAALQKGEDLSLYGPGPKSDFWVAQKDISKVDIRAAALGETMPMYEGLGNPFPQNPVFEYDEVKKSDTKPKLDVTTGEGKEKRKFKLKFTRELHADPTTAALMMALGYPQDLTKNARHIKVILGKKDDLSEIKRDWESYYAKKYDIEDTIESQGVDEKGRPFVIFNEGLIEAKSTGVERLGPWKYADADHLAQRELRGMTLVQMWLANTDIKEFGNNTVVLKKQKDGSYLKTLINSDPGHSFGNVLKEEAVQAFGWRMVSQNSKDSVSFDYRAGHEISLRNVMTLSDARWAARLIARLTRDQMATAVNLGGWPTCVQESLVGRLVARRNDLVQSLGLVGAKQADGSAIQLLASPSDLQSLSFDRSCAKGNSIASEDAAAQKFNWDFNARMRPILSTIKTQLLNLSRGVINGEKRIVLSSKDFRLDPYYVSEVILNLSRTIERNNSPKSEKDLFLVKDHFEVGLRLGAGYGPYVDTVYLRSFELAYPARTQAEAGSGNGFIVNLLLPKDAAEGKLPESYVLKTEHALEVGAGVQIDNLGLILSPTLRAGVSKVNLWRSIFDRRDPKRAVLYRDRSDFTRAQLDVFARLAIVRIPVFRALTSWGEASGKGVILDEADLKSAGVREAVDLAVTEGDFSGLAKQENDFLTSDQFKTSLKRWNLLVWKGRTEKRMDRVEVESDSSRNVVQFRTSKETSFSLFSAKTSKNATVSLYADPASPKEFELQVSVMGSDAKTTDKEMAKKFLRFVNGLSVDGVPLIPLTTSLGYTTNGSWGSIIAQSDTRYSTRAMAKILTASDQSFWSALSASMKVSGTVSSDEKNETVEHAKDFLKRLRKAASEKKLERKMTGIAEAFRGAVYGDGGFFSPDILGALNRIAGEDEIYSRNLITVPETKMVNLLEGTPMFGKIGSPMKTGLKYLVFAPVTAADLYYMFDTWF